MARWKKFDSLGWRCIEVKGDKNAPPTRWWNHWWLAWRGWRKVQVFGVSEEAARAGYRVGYRLANGKSYLCPDRLYYVGFRARIRRESREFFALIGDGKEKTEVVLAKGSMTRKDDSEHEGLPLF